MRCTPLILASLLFHVGCGRTNPVTEISLAQSGVELVESTDSMLTEGWPGWRGPMGDGIATDQDLVRVWDPSTNVRWRKDIPGRGHSSPIVVGESVILATAIDEEQQQLVISVDRTNGDEQWRQVIHEGGFPSRRQVHNKATHANGTVISNGTHLFTAFLNTDSIIATALRLDGEIAWQQEVGKFVSKWGYAPSPVLYKSLVIFAADNQGGGYLAALDVQSGSVAWRIARGNVSSYSSPAIANVGGRDQLLMSGGDAITSYDPATGEKNWSTPAISEATCGTIVTSGERIFASGGYPDRETVCLSADGAKLWSNNAKVYEPSMIVVGNKLVAITDKGVAQAWSVETGAEVFKRRLGGQFSASPILCDGHIYAPNLSGDTFVFKAEQKFELVSKNRLGSDCYASPAAADGHLFMRVGVGNGSDRHEQLVCLAKAESSPAVQSIRYASADDLVTVDRTPSLSSSAESGSQSGSPISHRPR